VSLNLLLSFLPAGFTAASYAIGTIGIITGLAGVIVGFASKSKMGRISGWVFLGAVVVRSAVAISTVGTVLSAFN
jgi:hypothetical protein